MMGNKNKISIIIPCYNAEDYISKCLDSVINQTYENIEIIVINDGSIDRTIEILENYASQDNRIVIIDKVNEGVSISRNVGLEKASGEYVMFVDSDDWIDSDNCVVALSEIEKQNADVIMWSYIREFPNASLKKIIYNEEKIIFDKLEIKNKLYRRQLGLYKEELAHPENMDALSPVWTKLYRLNLIRDNNIKFVDLSVIGTCEDGLFNLQVFNFAKKVIYINKYFYHYFKSNNESCTSNYKDKLYIQWKELFRIILNNLESDDPTNENFEAFNNRICLSIIGLGLNICQSNKNHIEKIKEINFIISSTEYRNAYKKLALKFFPLHWKIFFLCAKLNFVVGLYAQLILINHMIGRV